MNTLKKTFSRTRVPTAPGEGGATSQQQLKGAHSPEGASTNPNAKPLDAPEVVDRLGTSVTIRCPDRLGEDAQYTFEWTESDITRPEWKAAEDGKNVNISSKLNSLMVVLMVLSCLVLSRIGLAWDTLDLTLETI